MGLGFLDKLHFTKRSTFGSIEGYQDLKDIIERALETDENYNLLLVGPPASSKTLFLMGILDIRLLIPIR
jgi:hypothetical protein